ncbi:unnamed protein product [Coregonus sp. 'balchen']|nr:unnamed protein product [Coregonus sp. 'balchen']
MQGVWAEAHEAKDCDESKKCHGCGSSAHLWRECTACHKSYAVAAGGGAGAGAGDGGGRGGGVPDPSAGPEAIPSTTEEEPRTAAGGEGDGQETAVAVLEGEVVPETEMDGSVGEEVPEMEAAEGEEVGEEPATALGGEEKRGEGGPEWGESEMSSAQGDEVREMMEELVIKGGWVSPLPASPKKRGKRRGRSSDRKREMGGGGEGGRRAQDPLHCSQTCFEIGVLEVDGGEPRMQGTQEPNTIPASWVGEMEGSGGASGVESESLQEDMEQGSIRVLFETSGSATLNWNRSIAVVQRKLGMWRDRSLSFIGKVLVLKARSVMVWTNTGPRAEQLPWHFGYAAKWLRGHLEVEVARVGLDHRHLYEEVRRGGCPGPVLGIPAVVWEGVQVRGLDNRLKDLNWLSLHKGLPSLSDVLLPLFPPVPPILSFSHCDPQC